jgi:4-hydroxy-3-methylbut-2-enyl diphosphate reductase
MEAQKVETKMDLKAETKSSGKQELKINIARTAGFCFGVERAVEMAMDNAQQGKEVFMLGNIVHNEQVVERLRQQGIKVVDSLDKVDANGTLLIRAHGAVPQTVVDAKGLGLEVVDATCPMVTEIHVLVKELVAEGNKIVVIGDHDHQEVRGICGHAKSASATGDDPIVIAHPEEVETRMPRILKKAAVVVQSTQNIVNVQKIVSLLVPKVHSLHVVNTICGPTKSHQKEILQMPKDNDVIIIVGSFISANTKRLTSISSELNPRTYQVETAADVKDDWFTGAKSVGVTAGASTPDWLIQEVVERLKQIAV